jgi:hypothetical protein
VVNFILRKSIPLRSAPLHSTPSPDFSSKAKHFQSQTPHSLPPPAPTSERDENPNQLVNYSSPNNIKLQPASPIKTQTQERNVWNKGATQECGGGRKNNPPPPKRGRGKARQVKAHKAFHFIFHFYFPFSVCYLRTLPPLLCHRDYTVCHWWDDAMNAWLMPDGCLIFLLHSSPPFLFSLLIL